MLLPDGPDQHVGSSADSSHNSMCTFNLRFDPFLLHGICPQMEELKSQLHLEEDKCKQVAAELSQVHMYTHLYRDDKYHGFFHKNHDILVFLVFFY